MISSLIRRGTHAGLFFTIQLQIPGSYSERSFHVAAGIFPGKIGGCYQHSFDIWRNQATPHYLLSNNSSNILQVSANTVLPIEISLGCLLPFTEFRKTTAGPSSKQSADESIVGLENSPLEPNILP